MKRPLLISLIVGGLLVLLIAVVFVLFPPLTGFFLSTNYIVPRESLNRWQTIQYRNNRCPSLQKALFSHDIDIPDNGFLCTSDSQYTGWQQVRYYITEKDGTLAPLNGNKVIGFSSFSRAEANSRRAVDVADETVGCNWTGQEFFVGEDARFTEINPIRSAEAFLEMNPQCRS